MAKNVEGRNVMGEDAEADTGAELETWAEYTAAYAVIKPRIADFMTALAARFGAEACEDTADEDYGYAAAFEYGGIKYFASLTLQDAAAYGEGDGAGQKGNLMLSVIRDGGQIVIAYAPNNYTERCWVRYSNTAELLRRVPHMEHVSDCVISIRQDAERGVSN